MTTKAELQKENDTLRSIAGSVAIHVGANKDAVIEARTAIMGILECSQDQKTLRCALKTLDGVCAVNNAVISGNILTAGVSND